METPLTGQMRRTVVPAGRFRRTPLERSDQRIAWDRTDEAFFAAGACHVLAYRCAATQPTADAPLPFGSTLDAGGGPLEPAS